MKKLLAVTVLLLMMPVGYCQNQPLELTIKSDKQVYETGEDNNISFGITNVSDKTITTKNNLNWNDDCRLFFKNEKGEECILTYIGPIDMEIGDQLIAGKYYYVWAYPLTLLKDKEFKPNPYKFELTKGKDYTFIGKQDIYIKHLGLTSNTITIEVKEKIDIKKEEIKKLIEKSDIIILGEIVDIFDATPRDGGMSYDVKIEKLFYRKYISDDKLHFRNNGMSYDVKIEKLFYGEYISNYELHFRSPGLVGYAKYKEGERVLLFLKHWQNEIISIKPACYISNNKSVTEGLTLWPVEDYLDFITAEIKKRSKE
jgi:hypothetical protein